MHTFLSVISSWSTRLFCWFSEQQFSASEGPRQLKICFDDSKWRDYPNERQLSKPHPSLYPLISLWAFFFLFHPVLILHHPLVIHQIHCLIPPVFPFPPFSTSIMFYSLHHLSFLFPLLSFFIPNHLSKHILFSFFGYAFLCLPFWFCCIPLLFPGEPLTELATEAI